MASSYGKKSLKDSFNSAVRKVVATVMLLGAGAAPLYYEYGTVKEQDVKVTAYHDNHEYNYDTHKYEGSGYTLETDKGSFVVESSKWHLQSDEDAGKIYKQMTPSYSYFYSSSNDETYRIKTDDPAEKHSAADIDRPADRHAIGPER
ncbi:MAG: hypothetical protein HY052_06750 [Proteobacteria bacterium]|nr:hypothetical protein [Pseudomonadota bacterium]